MMSTFGHNERRYATAEEDRVGCSMKLLSKMELITP
jgi:hypothetical protein